MFATVAADLRALWNLFRFREGHRILVSSGISLLFLGIVSALFGAVLRESVAMTGGLDDLGPEEIRGLAAALLMPGLLLTAWFGFGSGSRQLFEIPWTATLLAATRRSGNVLIGVWLRTAAMTALWCIATCAPVMTQAAAAANLEIPLWSILIAAFLLVMPGIAMALALQVLAMRFFSGYRARRMLAVVSSLTSLAFSAMLLLGALAQRESVDQVVQLTRAGGRRGFLLDLPADWLAQSATSGLEITTVLWSSALVAITAAIVFAVGHLYRDAWANARIATQPPPRTPGRIAWPSDPAGSVFRKEWAQLLNQPNQIVGLLFSTLVVVVVAGTRAPEIVDRLGVGHEERNVLLMLALWLFAQLTTVPGCLLRLTIADASQWSLYVVAPAPAGRVLAGKLRMLIVLQAWPAVVTAVVAVVALDPGWIELLAFALIVPACVLWTAGATACVGTIPALMKPRPERGHLPGLAGVVIMVVILQLTVVPGLWLAEALASRHSGAGLFAGMTRSEAAIASIALVWGLALFGFRLAIALATRWFRKLSQAE